MVTTSASSRNQLFGTTLNALENLAPLLTRVPDASHTPDAPNTAQETNDPRVLWKDRKWAELIGFPGLYDVSDRGDVYCKTAKCFALTHGDKKGGLTVRLVRDGHTYWPSLQEVIAKTFVPNPDPVTNTYVGHINGHRKDNRPENLVWMRKNQLTQQLLEKTAMTKLSKAQRVHLEAQDILQIRAMYAAGVSIDVLAVEFSTSASNVRSIIKRETWWHLPEGMEELPSQALNVWNERGKVGGVGYATPNHQ